MIHLKCFVIELPCFNLRRGRTGEGAFYFTTQSGFSAKAVKRRGAASPFLAYLSMHTFCIAPESFGPRSSQIWPPGQASEPTSKYDCAVHTVFKRLTWNFQEFISASVGTKCISRNFDFGELRSGQFCDLKQWEGSGKMLMKWEIKMYMKANKMCLHVLFRTSQVYSESTSGTREHAINQDFLTLGSSLDGSYAVLFLWPLRRVIRGHAMPFFAFNSWKNQDRTLGIVTICFSCIYTSSNMQHDVIGRPRDPTWARLRVRFWHWSA